jgi:hypothetical protein
MSTTRRRRIRAHRDEVLAQHAQRHRQVDAEVARIQQFDDALPKAFAWVAIAVFIAVAIVVLVA